MITVPGRVTAEPVGGGAASPETWIDGPWATGSWGGARTRLSEAGVDVYASYVTGFFANAKGGLDTGIRYDGLADWGFALDLERLVRWPGASFRMNWYSYHGGLPSTELVGVYPTQAVNGNESEARIRFFEIAIQQMLFDRQLRIEIGQLTSDSEFFQSESSSLLLNGTFGFLGIARSVTPFYPNAAPGVLAAWRTFNNRFEVRFAAYTADIGEDVLENIGFDWGFHDGVSLFGEVLVRPTVLGRTGTLSFGVVGLNSSHDGTTSGLVADSGFGFYGVIDWPLWAAEEGGAEISAFSRSFGSPRKFDATIHWYTSFGFAASGIVPGRPLDTLGVGFTWQSFGGAYLEAQAADGIDVTNHESIIELTYLARVCGWLSLQPDLQIALDPHFSGRDAVVIGLRAVIDL